MTADRPHISYYDAANDDLKYAHWDGATWVIETVDSSGWVGKYTSLALNTAGRPHISYYDMASADLKYARWDGATWVVETVDSGGEVGWYNSLVLDEAGRPHISYHDTTNEDLRYARLASPPAGSDGLVARVFIDQRCDGFFQNGLDIPLVDVSVTLSFSNGASETRQTRSFGLVNFAGFDASSGVTISVTLPTSYGDYPLGACLNSLTSIELRSADFQFGNRYVQFGAGTVGGETNDD